VGYAAVVKAILGGIVNVRQTTFTLGLTLSQGAKLTGTLLCVATEVTACAGCASASLVRTGKKLSPENIASVTTTPVTGTMGCSVLGKTMENVCVEGASVKVTGMLKATLLVNAEQATAPVSPPMENTVERSAQDMVSASVGSASVKKVRMGCILENIVRSVLPARDLVRSCRAV